MGLPNKEPIGRLEQMAAQIAELLAWKEEKEMKDARWRKLSDRWIKGTQEAADILGVSKSTLEKRRNRQLLPVEQPPRSL